MLQKEILISVIHSLQIQRTDSKWQCPGHLANPQIRNWGLHGLGCDSPSGRRLSQLEQAPTPTLPVPSFPIPSPTCQKDL